MDSGEAPVGRRLGRYVIYEAIASGGMASVHFGRMCGPIGFARTVAIKRLHPHHARDPEFVSMFINEARLAARAQHPNVVSTLDVVTVAGEVFLVMDYVRGESLSTLLRGTCSRGERVPLPVLGSILSGTLHGLHAAHEATSDSGEPLMIVHRDVSPQNILVGEDGVARLADFGVAKASWRAQSTRDGQVKGKLSYMAPEQLNRSGVDRRTDLYAVGVVLWETLTGRKLVEGDEPGSIIAGVLASQHRAPSSHVTDVPPELDALVMRALAASPHARFATALEMASELERAVQPAPQSVVAEWVRASAPRSLADRAARLAAIEAEALPAEDETLQGAPSIALAARDSSELRRMSEEPTNISPSGHAASSGEIAANLDIPAPAVEGQGARRARVMIGFVAAGLVVLGAAAVASLSRWSHPAAPAAVPAEPTLAAVASTVGSPSDPPSVAAPPSSQASPLAATSASLPPVTPRKRAAPAARAKDCDPPYTIVPNSLGPDGQPVTRFKVWCL